VLRMMAVCFEFKFLSDNTEGRIRRRFSAILLLLCTVFAIVQCQTLKPADAQFIADFRASSPGFAALYPGDICTEYQSSFECDEEGYISLM
jgi:hypothetical protein